LVAVRIQGGIGNQLFQIAAGFFVAKNNSVNELTLDTTRVAFGTDRTRRLEALNFELLPRDFVMKIEGVKAHYLASLRPSRIGSMVAVSLSKLNDALRRRDHLIFHENSSSESLSELKSKTILHGYFNDFDIVRRAENFGFSRNISLTNNGSAWLGGMMSRINFDECIAMHVRLGDYLRFPQIFGTLSEDFYFKCLEHVNFRSKDEIVIFSDEPNRVANMFPRISDLPNVMIIRQPINSPSFETLFLMSQFRRLICANSTFSMWAAWFNDNSAGQGKLVTVPSPYLLNQPDMKTPKTWMKVSREDIKY